MPSARRHVVLIRNSMRYIAIIVNDDKREKNRVSHALGVTGTGTIPESANRPPTDFSLPRRFPGHSRIRHFQLPEKIPHAGGVSQRTLMDIPAFYGYSALPAYRTHKKRGSSSSAGCGNHVRRRL